MQTVRLPDDPKDTTQIIQQKSLAEKPAQAEVLTQFVPDDNTKDVTQTLQQKSLSEKTAQDDVLTHLVSELNTLKNNIEKELRKIQSEHPSSTTTQCALSIDSTLTSIKSLIVNAKQTLDINALEQQINDRLSKGINNLTNVPNPSMWEHVKQLFVNFGTRIANLFRKHDNKVKLSDIDTVKTKNQDLIQAYKTQTQELFRKTGEETTWTPKT